MKEEKQEEVEKERLKQMKEEKQEEVEKERLEQMKEEKQEEVEKERREQMKEEKQEEVEKERREQMKEEKQEEVEKERLEQMKEERLEEIEEEKLKERLQIHSDTVACLDAGAVEGMEASQVKKKLYRLELLEQMAEQRRNKRKEKELEMRVAATGAVDPEKTPERIAQFREADLRYDSLGQGHPQGDQTKTPVASAAGEKPPPGKLRVAFSFSASLEQHLPALGPPSGQEGGAGFGALCPPAGQEPTGSQPALLYRRAPEVDVLDVAWVQAAQALAGRARGGRGPARSSAVRRGPRHHAEHQGLQSPQRQR
ncbi:unnamed protein product [Merluccius merluccius]